MDLIDLTKEEDEEMEVAAPTAVVVVKTESIEAPEAPIDDRRRSSRLERASLRKNVVIPEKEAPLAASDTIADTNSNMSEDTSVNPESGNTTNIEQTIAEIDAAIAASQKVIDEFDD
jgi:hypothetical protein